MNYIDWIVLFGALLFIVLYGVLKTRGSKDIESYLKGDNTMKWWMIGVSIMATQASAVTFLSTPGQAVEDGMRFIQFYLGVPLAMIIISVTMVPIYYRLKVFTAYEYLEGRFDLKTRTLAAILFLILRGLSAGITLFAPSIILSAILGWNTIVTSVFIGILVIIYVVSGGTRAVSLTQRQQLAIIMGGMILAGVMAFTMLPDNVSFGNTLSLAGALGKFNLITTGLEKVEALTFWDKVKAIATDRFNIWSGLLASTFLFLSYFGTDQSQVARYLGGKSLRESRMGLIFNGLLKVPMQFIILFIGVMVFVFYLFNQPPVFHNEALKHRALETASASKLQVLEKKYDDLYTAKRSTIESLLGHIKQEDDKAVEQSTAAYQEIDKQEQAVRAEVKEVIGAALPEAKTQDRDYIFLTFVIHYLPHGIVGLLLAVMFSAAMSSMASELNALAATTTVDIYKRSVFTTGSAAHYLRASRLFTIMWAMVAMSFAVLASFAENLIQFVNIVGSLFYGTILGIFLVAFYIKHVKGTAVFIAALIAECAVIYCYKYTDLAFLLYNIIGCVVVVGLSLVFQAVFYFYPNKK